MPENQNEPRMEEKPDFPEPIVRIIKTLADKQRRQILIELRRDGELSWSQLLEGTNVVKGTLNSHLNELEAAGMIRNFSKENPTSGEHSYYEITPLATRIVDALFGVFNIQKTAFKIPNATPLLPIHTLGQVSGYGISLEPVIRR